MVIDALAQVKINGKEHVLVRYNSQKKLEINEFHQTQNFSEKNEY